MDRTLIFCHSYRDEINIHQFFKISLGDHWLEPPDSPDYVKYRVVDLFTHCTHSSVKKKIIEQFSSKYATLAFGLGMELPRYSPNYIGQTKNHRMLKPMYKKVAGLGRDGKQAISY